MSESNEHNRMLNEIEKRLQSGSLPQAKRAFTQNWRDSVPELPIRFSAVLKKIDRQAAQEVLQLWRDKNKTPQLKLEWHEDQVKVKMARGRKLVLGYLPNDDVQLLREMGKKAQRAYKPHLLEIKHNHNNDIAYIAVELVRPEAKICPICGTEHNEEDFYCSKCSAEKRSDKNTEHSSIHFQEALEAIADEENNSSETKD